MALFNIWYWNGCLIEAYIRTKIWCCVYAVGVFKIGLVIIYELYIRYLIKSFKQLVPKLVEKVYL